MQKPQSGNGRKRDHMPFMRRKNRKYKNQFRFQKAHDPNRQYSIDSGHPFRAAPVLDHILFRDRRYNRVYCFCNHNQIETGHCYHASVRGRICRDIILLRVLRRDIINIIVKKNQGILCKSLDFLFCLY